MLKLDCRIGKPHWDSGYVTEAARAFIGMALRTCNIGSINVYRQVNNPDSRRVIQKCGFRFWKTGMINSTALNGAAPSAWYHIDRKAWISLRNQAAAMTGKTCNGTCLSRAFRVRIWHRWDTSA